MKLLCFLVGFFIGMIALLDLAICVNKRKLEKLDDAQIEIIRQAIEKLNEESATKNDKLIKRLFNILENGI